MSKKIVHVFSADLMDHSRFTGTLEEVREFLNELESEAKEEGATICRIEVEDTFTCTGVYFVGERGETKEEEAERKAEEIAIKADKLQVELECQQEKVKDIEKQLRELGK